jgi:hypothetical protein
MNDGVDMALSVEFRAVFDEVPRSLDEYLTGISRSMMLNAASFFLGFSNNNSQSGTPEKLVEIFFCTENRAPAIEIYQRLKRLEREHGAELRIINPQSSLQLFEYCFNHLTEESRQAKPEAEINIFKAYLLLNQLNTTKEQVAFTSVEELPKDIKLAGMFLSQSYPYSDLCHYDTAEIFVGQVIKSIFLFELLESSDLARPLLNASMNTFRVQVGKTTTKR